ncbi:MAG: zinc metallopeptidase, partial [Gammaproteobacteria bacterium]
MHIVVLTLVILLLILGPGLWVKSVMARYSLPADRYGKSGEDVARELLNHLGLHDVGTEKTEA